MNDYYGILSVKCSASPKEIKKSYRREAFKWHPDRNSTTEASIKMKLINEAYLILMDDEARSRYDREFSNYQEYMSSNSNHGTESEYLFKDEILFNWIKSAQEQAKDLFLFTLDDFTSMGKVGLSAFYNRTKYWILALILLNLLFLAYD